MALEVVNNRPIKTEQEVTPILNYNSSAVKLLEIIKAASAGKISEITALEFATLVRLRLLQTARQEKKSSALLSLERQIYDLEAAVPLKSGFLWRRKYRRWLKDISHLANLHSAELLKKQSYSVQLKDLTGLGNAFAQIATNRANKNSDDAKYLMRIAYRLRNTKELVRGQEISWLNPNKIASPKLIDYLLFVAESAPEFLHTSAKSCIDSVSEAAKCLRGDEISFELLHHEYCKSSRLSPAMKEFSKKQDYESETERLLRQVSRMESQKTLQSLYADSFQPFEDQESVMLEVNGRIEVMSEAKRSPSLSQAVGSLAERLNTTPDSHLKTNVKAALLALVRLEEKFFAQHPTGKLPIRIERAFQMMNLILGNSEYINNEPERYERKKQALKQAEEATCLTVRVLLQESELLVEQACDKPKTLSSALKAVAKAG